MRKIVAYKAFTYCLEIGGDPDIDRALEDGWELYGPPMWAEEHYEVVQVMVKYEEEVK